MKKKIRLLNIFQQHVFVLVILLTCILGYLWISLEIGRSKLQSREIRQSYLTSEKKLLRAKVEHVLKYIEYKKSLAQTRVKKGVKSRTQEAFQTALYIYQKNKDSKTLTEIELLVHDALFAASWDDGKGYYFVENMAGIEKVNRNNPELEGKDISDIQDSQGNFVMRNILSAARSTEGEGFYTYYWNRPGSPDRLEPKISFVKFFKPLDWVIGNGKYLEDERQTIKREVLEWVEKLNLNNDNNLFIGGFNGLTMAGTGSGKNMLNVINSNGEKVVQKMIDTAKNGGGFVEYVMPKLPGLPPAPKISYVAAIPDWNWYVGVGVYIDYIDTVVQQKQNEAKKTAKEFLIQCIAALSLIALLSLILTFFLSRKIRLNITLFQKFFRESATRAIPIQLDLITFEEFHSLAISANQMAVERRRAWESLTENQIYLKSIFNAPNEAITIYDLNDGSILDVNHAMLEMYGLSYEEAVTIPVENVSFAPYPYDHAEMFKMIRQVATSGPQTFEWKAKNKSGRFFWMEISLNLTEINDMGFVIAVGRNIDAKKRAERVLATEQERLAVTMRSIDDGVITTDTEEKIVLINKAAERMTGWNKKDALGRPIEEIFDIIDERTGEPCENPAKQVLLSGKIIARRRQRTLITRDGQQLSIAESGAPLMDKESKIIGVVLVFRDITNEKKTEQELLKIRKLESVGILAGGIAHDFNNILTAILGNIELASLTIGKEHKVSPLLVSAIGAASRATKLTQQLLTFAKGGDPVKETIALPQIIEESAEFVLHGSNITISYDFQPNLFFVDIDTGQMGQVIQNIILNARHSMPNGGKITVQCTNIKNSGNEPLLSDDSRKYVKVKIGDSGIGIQENLIDKIFDPYFSTKQEGSGLGLAICHSIINKHEGFIVAESTPGQGSFFTIYLPATSNKYTSSEQQDDDSLLRLPTRSAWVMVMDDEELVQNVAKSQLEFLGHKVVLVSDGLEAIETYKKRLGSREKIDIIIMDLTIPGGVGGKEAVKVILQEDPDARVIVSSGYSTDPVMANYKQYGFQAALTKPMVLNELKKAIALVI